MSSFLRPLAQHSAVAARRIPRQCATIRTFHTPLVAHSQAQISRKAQPHQTGAEGATFAYEKQYDFSYEPLSTGSPAFGNRIFVASQPDATAGHYKVPSGVYPVSLPFSTPEINGS